MGALEGIVMADPTRAEFTARVSETSLRAIVTQPGLCTLQCSEPVGDHVWKLINEIVCTSRPDIEIRIYGHYGAVCDLRIAKLLPRARRFSADCLTRAIGVESLAEMRHLESLSVGVFELGDFGFLDHVTAGLTSLRLGPTRSKRSDLSPLRRFPALRTLTVAGHTKGIEVLAHLLELEQLMLRSVTTTNLQYLEHLPKLWSLDIGLGGIHDFGGVEGKGTVKHLQLWRIRELPSLDVIGSLPNLQNVSLEALPQIRAFPKLVNSLALRRVVIDNLKGLQDFSAFESAPALEEFGFLQGSKQSPEQLLPVLRNPGVRRVSAFFGSDRKNDEFSALRQRHGKDEFQLSHEFAYR
jgi:hypothetical protein